jgi:hypothetical protein
MEVDFDFIGFIGYGDYKKRAGVALGNVEENKEADVAAERHRGRAAEENRARNEALFWKKGKEEEIAAEAGHHKGHCPCRMGSPNSQL